jgi:hypothetical protein
MWTLCLDDSGSGGEPIVALAGYLASDIGWLEFERHVPVIFKRYGISSFHATDFEKTRGEFMGWSRIKKNSFIQDFFGTTADVISLGVSASVKKSTFVASGEFYRIAHNSSPIGFSFNMVLDWVLNHEAFVASGEPLAIVIEAGNKNAGDMKRVFHAVRAQHRLESVLRSIAFASKKSGYALQLADFLAYYSRRHAEACDKGGFGLPYGGRLQIAIKSARTVPHLGKFADKFYP